MPPGSDDSWTPDLDSESNDDTVTDEQAERWMLEYRNLARAGPLSKEDKRRLGDLHSDLANYRLTDPSRFDAKFNLINGQDPELVEVVGAPRKTSNHCDKKGKGRYPAKLQTRERQSNNPTDIIEQPVGAQGDSEPVGSPVARYSSNWKKNHQRIIYRIGTSDRHEIGKSIHWEPSKLANLPDISTGEETILDIPLNNSPFQPQYNFCNIEKIVAVIVPYSDKATHESRSRVPLSRPTFVLIKWKDILPNHLKHSSFTGECESFVLKSKLLATVSKSNANILRDWIENMRLNLTWTWYGLCLI